MSDAVGAVDLHRELNDVEDKIQRLGPWSLHERWSSGRLMIQLRSPDTNYLPKGRLSTLAATLKVSTRELSNRMRVAESFRTDAAFKKAARRFGSWSAIVKSLPATREARVPHSMRSAQSAFASLHRLHRLLAQLLAGDTLDGQKLYHARKLYDLLEEDDDLTRR